MQIQLLERQVNGMYLPRPVESSLERARSSRCCGRIPHAWKKAAALPFLVNLLQNSGVFRAAMPQAWGGPELTSMQQTELVETIATGDVSAA
ncbi:MAG: hypothetical protein CBARDCOR_5863 [uncultured Caballeronia sp.]|nr:MAG: hypothetical protein CBARDCOR_5863 [uncultured Caballeronia sp.]